MVAPIYNLDPKLLPEKDQRSCDGRGGGQGNSYFIASVVLWKEKALDMGGPSMIDFIYFWGSNKKQRSCDGWWGGARSAPFGMVMCSKRRVRAAHGRARAAKTH
jgi:hypothetical protein